MKNSADKKTVAEKTTKIKKSTEQNEKEIGKEYRWNLSDIYKNYKEWEKDYRKVEKQAKDLVSYKGKLGKEKTLLEFLKKQEEMDKLSYKLYRYPQLAKDLNSLDKEAVENLQKVQFLFSKINTELSWINSELINNRNKIEKWIVKKEFSDYRFGLENLFRLQEHILKENESKLLSFYSSYMSAPRTIYSEITVTDVEWPTVKLSTGEEVEVTPANYGKILTKNRNQEDRKLMFENYYGLYKKRENTIAAVYNSLLQRDIAAMKSHNYETFLSSFLEGNNIPEKVYLNLINTAKKNTEPLKRYLKLRKKILGLKKYHNYDGSINLVEFDKDYEYDDAKEIVLKSVAPLGEEYTEKMKKAISEGWLDVFEAKGKRSGAYSAGVYGVHPYMLLNYNKTLDSVFTLAHELGHTLHTLYSDENQPFSTSGYTIFVAEVASTFNEKLLLDYMLENTEDIGSNNPMSGNIYSAYVFMAVCRAGDFCVDDFKEVIVEFLNNKLIAKLRGHFDLNKPKDMKKFSDRMHRMAEWADKHSEYKDKTWDFNFDNDLHRDGFYYHFTRCPLEKFARDNGYLDLLPMCCDIDYIMFEKGRGVLYRESTLASGGKICDYWIVGDKNRDPK